MDRRWRLLGLIPDKAATRARSTWGSCAGPATVVVRKDDCRQQGCAVHGKF
jgi:hypothetical protein